jgi:DNA repair exonuclease SbcCD ATPase subunit
MILPSQKTGASAAYRKHCNRREESSDKGGIGFGMQHLLEQVQGLERALRHADRREQSLKQKVSDLEEAKAGLQTTGMRTEADIDSLKKDLKSKPARITEISTRGRYECLDILWVLCLLMITLLPTRTDRPTLKEWNATQKQRKDLEARLKNALQELR